ncbi:AraC family transcriptional regulator [Paenisporosarcina sp. OV554]|uniref:AraC family transcriptional regulator n=1 Tax=Paenisporosarcina sp. OV554 TaxID=2135694 RepID=UPI000D376C33|nr:AraC family transcriptional regulator [Paenisporosarcina sp. OV554]PUB16606.1 AraC family transcriptional regulator [Paenisporosarcina sp. OV554]
MNWIDALQRSIDYLENHLESPFKMEDAAAEANVSVFHFQRIFLVLTDMSVMEYVRRRRLTLAAQELALTNVRVIEVALKFGYETPEAFAKAFKRQHGMSPSEARTSQKGFTTYNRLVISVQLKGALPMKVRIDEKQALQIIGVKRTFSFENGENTREIPKMWEEVHQNGVNDELESMNNGEVNGMLGVCRMMDSSTSTMEYWIATAYEGDEVSERYERLEIPAATYAIFEVVGPMPEAIQSMWEKIYSEWFPSSSYRPSGSAEMEVYTHDDATKADYYSEIWIPIVNK